LNNLGYISELQGQLDRAESFYAMASKQAVGAWIDVSTEKDLEGKPMTYALNDLKSAPMRINRMNFDAMNLLSQGRALEADTLLRHALAIDPHNSFTLNNLGVASEALGEYEAALRDYTAAAAAGSSEQVVVTPDDAWMGQPVSKMAADNARNLEARLQELSSDVERAAVLNARGVAAINQNNWEAARQDFLKAYSLNPYSAFSLNNAGYVAEREGDVESAQFFYARARQANDAGARVGLATTLAAEGGPLAAVASNNDQETENKLEEQRLERHRQKGPIQLLHPNGTPVVTSQSTPKDMLPAGDQPPMPSSPTQPQP